MQANLQTHSAHADCFPSKNENARDLSASGASLGDLAVHRIMIGPSASRSGSGLPLSPLLPARPGLHLRVSPYPAPFGFAWRPILRLPLVSALRLCRRSTFEFPRIPDASALHRLIKFQVAPVLCASAPPLMSSRVAPRPHLRLYRRWIVESPRFSHLSAVPGVKASSFPAALHLRYRRRSVSRLPRICIFRHRLIRFPGSPRFTHHPVSPSSNFRVAPNLRFWPAAGLTS